MDYIILLILGIIIGIVDYVFGSILMLISTYRGQYFFELTIFLPIFGIIMVWFYKHYGKNSDKGIKLIIQSSKEEVKVPKRIIIFSMIMTWLSHLFGASVGREGVAVCLGGSVANSFHNKLKLSRQEVVAIGMAGGFAGLFGTPFGAAIFPIEILKIKKNRVKIYLLSLYTGLIASYTSKSLGLSHFKYILTGYKYGVFEYLKYILIASLVALMGYIFAYTLVYFKKKLSSVNSYYKIFIGAIILAFFIILIHNGRYSGLGINLIFSTDIYSYDFLLKTIFTIFSIVIGFQGGEVTPLFSIGSSLSYILSNILKTNPYFSMAIGYSIMFGAATGAFLSSYILGIEVFGAQFIVFFIPYFIFKLIKTKTIYD